MKWPVVIPAWVVEGLKFVGLAEIPGKKHNPTIVNWLKKLKAWWAEDETPWCGTFIGHCIDAAGLPLPQHWYRAKAWADYGIKVSKTGVIPFGAICVKSRVGGGHVFLAVAKSADGTVIYGLGGNQGNKVSIVPFPLVEIDVIVWPSSRVPQQPLPVTTRAEIGAVERGSEA